MKHTILELNKIMTGAGFGMVGLDYPVEFPEKKVQKELQNYRWVVAREVLDYLVKEEKITPLEKKLLLKEFTKETK